MKEEDIGVPEAVEKIQQNANGRRNEKNTMLEAR